MAKASNKNEGYIYLHRKIRKDWKWENLKYRNAWIWILVNAEWNKEGYNGLKRGQVRFSVKQARELWGMSPATAKRFLNKCEKDKSIMWTRGYPGPKFYSAHEPNSEPNREPIRDPKAGIITVLNYDKYQQPTKGDEPNSEPIGNPNSEPLTNTSSNASTNKRRKKPQQPMDKSQKKQKKMTKEEVELAIDSLDLISFFEKYQDVEVAKEFDKFREYFLYKNDSKTGKPNWMKWTDWNKSFHRWCKNALEWNKGKKETTNSNSDLELINTKGMTKEEVFINVYGVDPEVFRKDENS